MYPQFFLLLLIASTGFCWPAEYQALRCTHPLRAIQPELFTHCDIPKREEKLIQALGLGNPGPIGTTLTNLINGTTSALEMQNFELDVNEQAGTHCSGELVCNTEMNRDMRRSPFGKHLRQRRHDPSKKCTETSNHHILFVLDSSGSIGSENYQRMLKTVARITSVSCRKPKFALLSFSSNLKMEFCFDCFSSTDNGRTRTVEAILNAEYQRGNTKTGEAVKCVCDFILDAQCGSSADPNCLDVVLITDGQSNGALDPCNEVSCLTNLDGVNTYAIGIGGNVKHTEIECLTHSSEIIGQFDYKSFDDFERAVNTMVNRITADDTPYECVTTDMG